MCNLMRISFHFHSFRPLVRVDPADEHIAGLHGKCSCSEYVAPKENVNVDQEADIRCKILNSHLGGQVPNSIDGNVDSAAGANPE